MYEHFAKYGEIKILDILKNFSFLMIFFPSVTFGIFGDNVEIFPWGIIFGLVFINRVIVHYILIFFFFFPWLIYAIYVDYSDFEIYRSLASY